MKNLFLLAFFAFVCLGVILLTGGNSRATLLEQGEDIMTDRPEGYPSAVLAGGCFWCTESEFRALDGVLYTRAGYMGGSTDSPSYRDITTGKTGHAEVIEVTFDPAIISYETIVEFFFTDAHDPTQLNRQGVDKGTQYRSAIFPPMTNKKRLRKMSLNAFSRTLTVKLSQQLSLFLHSGKPSSITNNITRNTKPKPVKIIFAW